MGRVVWFLLFAVTVIGMFVIKNRVIGLEKELNGIKAQIQTDQKAIHVLKAEWAYLSNPDRLRALGQRHAGMKQIEGNRIITISALPFKEPEQKPSVVRVSYSPERSGATP